MLNLAGSHPAPGSNSWVPVWSKSDGAPSQPRRSGESAVRYGVRTRAGPRPARWYSVPCGSNPPAPTKGHLGSERGANGSNPSRLKLGREVHIKPRHREKA